MSPRARKNLWLAWFIILFILPYTPVVSPTNLTAEIAGIPAQLVVWLAFTVLLILSIWTFVYREWRI
jgi:hypothetical protein